LFPIDQTYSYISLKELENKIRIRKKYQNSGFFKNSLIKIFKNSEWGEIEPIRNQ
jgi:hypothetical protein